MQSLSELRKKKKKSQCIISAGSMGELNRQPPKVPSEKRPLNFYQ